MGKGISYDTRTNKWNVPDAIEVDKGLSEKEEKVLQRIHMIAMIQCISEELGNRHADFSLISLNSKALHIFDGFDDATKSEIIRRIAVGSLPGGEFY